MELYHKMHKGEFNISVMRPSGETSKKTVKGYIGQDFGIHRDDCEQWQVTHFRTGMGMRNFPLLKYAKEFVKALENCIFPVPISKMTPLNCHNNAETIGRILEAMFSRED